MLASLRRASNNEMPPDSPVAFHTPLLHNLVANLNATQRHVVLELGAASTPMLALLGQSRCRVEIVDLAHFGGIERLNTTEPRPLLTSAANALLPKQRCNDEFDLVFCWDLPNYLTLDALSVLMKNIADRARPGAIAHALIYYSEPDMPEHPGRFLPTLDGSELINSSTAQPMISAPRYSPEDLNMRMGGFEIDRARLLSNGMQEFLFRL